MFLPSSVGGDAYKVYLLYDQYPETATKNIVSATLFDRLCGLAVLTILALICICLSSFTYNSINLKPLFFGLAFLILPAFWLLSKILFKPLLPKFTIATLLSVIVQMGDMIAAYLLLIALGVHNYFIDYLTLFLFSSVAAVIPISLSGVGARELVFLMGYDYLNISQETAVAFTLSYFSLLVSTSIIGLPFVFSTKINNNPTAKDSR